MMSSKLSTLGYRCVLVEDEPLAIEMMVEYISERNELNLIEVVDNLDEYEGVLKGSNNIDIIFLDLKIRGGEVFELMQENKNYNSIFVIVSAHAYSHTQRLPEDINKYFITKPVSNANFNSCMDRILNDKVRLSN